MDKKKKPLPNGKGFLGFDYFATSEARVSRIMLTLI